jgi:DNA mismatch repair ATPase MutS
VVLLANGALILSLRRRLETLLARTDRAFEDIELLEQVAERIEREQFSSSRLRDLVARLRSQETSASRAMKRFGLIVDMVRSRESLFLRTVDWPLLYSVNMGYVAEKWRRRHGGSVRAWLNAVGEVEALVSLATYHYEHPTDTFPEFTTGAATLEARSLGHPLIPAATCVRNDISISGDARVLLVSGSNMSGKSTLLRSAGINVVMAMAGAPARAAAMRLTPLQVGASIRINDSLHEGSSRFYAEVKRLRAILDLAGGEPNLLFLLDEFLQGTNSQDRRVGAEGALRALVEKGAIGLISTHDLALTDVSGGNHWVHNVHFQDEFVGQEMRFDYKLREGVVTKSNGLELMRALGIKV